MWVRCTCGSGVDVDQVEMWVRCRCGLGVLVGQV